jgi:hypothetical protein
MRTVFLRTASPDCAATIGKAIISYITTNVMSVAFLRPNSIMQGHMNRLGAMVRW